MKGIENVKGPVFRPEDGGFDGELAGYQAAHPHRPDLVVGAETADDVQAAVRYAADHGLPVAVETSGHGRAVPLTGGVLISTRRMDGVHIDPVTRVARVEAGTRWAQVVTAAAAHGLVPPSGSSPEAGVVGYTLGGGIGVLARELGWASDRVRTIDLVTADGLLRRVTADSDPELFRVLRGAGHGLGVVTAMEIELAPGDRIYGGALSVAGEHVRALLGAYREWTADLPDGLTSSIGALPYPDLPMVPEHLRGRYVAQVRIAWTGSAAEGERLVAPLRAAVPTTGSLGELPYTQAATIFNEPDQPHPYTGTNAMLRELDPAVLDAALDITGPDAPVMCVLGLRHMGGALARPPAVPDAVAHRDAPYLLQILSLVDGTDVPGRLHRELMDAVAPWTAGRTPNFRFGEQAAKDWPIEVAGRAELAAERDPKGLFQ
ncbi:FAD/FMN-containing dehydrogenase [Pseudonocardia hierapolitana]|uniref:FAD/FMN-containing dehydrogenase n=1 Tax=Pseudonocardia hierapolitana TaxID=1128676 RepID=A0A561SW40_9PSEU|nr:FAD-binding oxidoreductase [Pseudonocardia hierapolitana]TWF79079.1 FAD/FMN-containing dehydrogenase [Pseudonocardia hierapolitana]